MYTPRERTVALIRQLNRYKLVAPRQVLPVAQHPDEIIHVYYAWLKSLLGRARALVERELVPRLPDLAVRFDADDPAPLFERIGRLWDDTFSPAETERFARGMAERTADFQREQIHMQARAALGAEIMAAEPNIEPRMAAFVVENVALIKSVPGEFLASLEKNLAREIAAGASVSELSTLISDYYGFAERRATKIARDQVGKWFGQLNMVRQRAMGVKSFIWRDLDDDKVRPLHRRLNGQKFDWDKLPSEGAPGTPVNCRCYAEPVFDDIIREAGAPDDFDLEFEPQEYERPAPEPSPIPAHRSIPARGTERTVPASSLSGTTSFGEGLEDHFRGLHNAAAHLEQVTSLEKLFQLEGQAAVDRLHKQQPIKVGVSPSGVLEALNGRHRILAAQRVPGLKIPAKFVRTVE